MKIPLRRNRRRRANFNSTEFSIQQLRWGLFSMIGKQQLAMSLSERHKYDFPIFQIQKKLMLRKAEYSISKIRNVCYVTGHERGVSRAFRLSRQTFKEQMQQHYYVGLTRFPAARG